MNTLSQRIAFAAAAGSFKVSSNGTDSATCGKTTAPCATIAQAVTNAKDGDSIAVGAGSYAGTTVNKKLKLWSSDGNGGAIITSQMTLSVDGIAFGKTGNGFSLIPGTSSTAIAASGNEISVRGNLSSVTA
jgi:hypothetical protein